MGSEFTVGADEVVMEPEPPPEHEPLVFDKVPVAEMVTLVRQFDPPLVVELVKPVAIPEEFASRRALATVVETLPAKVEVTLNVCAAVHVTLEAAVTNPGVLLQEIAPVEVLKEIGDVPEKRR